MNHIKISSFYYKKSLKLLNFYTATLQTERNKLNETTKTTKAKLAENVIPPSPARPPRTSWRREREEVEESLTSFYAQNLRIITESYS